MRAGLLCLAIIGLTGCSNPRGTVIPRDPEKWGDLAPTIEKLPQSDKELLAQYMVRTRLGSAFGRPGMPDGMTVGKAIDEQKAIVAAAEKQEAEAKMLAEKVRREHEATVAAVNAALAVGLVSKGYSPSDFSSGRYEDRITCVFAFQNKSAKDIAGVKGIGYFIDLFGDTISHVGISYDETIKAGTTGRWSAQKRFNQFEHEDVKLRDTQMDKLRFVFDPEMVVFSDGTSMKASD